MGRLDVQVQCPECGELVYIFPCSECGAVVIDERLYSHYKVNGCTKHNIEGLCQRYTVCDQCNYFHQAQLVHILHNGCILRDISGTPRKFRVVDIDPANIQCKGVGREFAVMNRGMYPHNVLKAHDRNDIDWWRDSANIT